MNDDIEIIRAYQDAWGHHRDVPESTIHRLEEALQRSANGHAPEAPTEPRRCFEPDWMARQERRWGVTVQLYGLRSPRNWGIGDFSDLKQLVQLAARQGADFVGVNPLHALYAAEPRRYSPYSPSSREFLNVLYIDPEAMQAVAISPAARAHIAEASFQERLQTLRDAPLVDYVAVAHIKREVFRLIFTDFGTLCARGTRPSDRPGLRALRQGTRRNLAALRDLSGTFLPARLRRQLDELAGGISRFQRRRGA